MFFCLIRGLPAVGHWVGLFVSSRGQFLSEVLGSSNEEPVIEGESRYTPIVACATRHEVRLLRLNYVRCYYGDPSDFSSNMSPTSTSRRKPLGGTVAFATLAYSTKLHTHDPHGGIEPATAEPHLCLV